jgi:hypothetical protein
MDERFGGDRGLAFATAQAEIGPVGLRSMSEVAGRSKGFNEERWMRLEACACGTPVWLLGIVVRTQLSCVGIPDGERWPWLWTKDNDIERDDRHPPHEVGCSLRVAWRRRSHREKQGRLQR